MQHLVIKNAKTHNLKGVDLQLEPDQLIVFTGVSGSGKSSLVFDTIYMEGQRRYIESLSVHARRHMGSFPKPDVESIEGIGPVIAIEQKTLGGGVRSTVGTITGIYDFLRLLFAKASLPHCPISGEPVQPQSVAHIAADIIKKIPEGTRMLFLSPYKGDLETALRQGFTRARIDGVVYDLTENIKIKAEDTELVVDRLVMESDTRIIEAVTKSLDKGLGVMKVLRLDTQEELFYAKEAYSPRSGISYPPLEPHDFSFNHPLGMCPHCHGLGRSQDFDLDVCIDPHLSIAEGACKIATPYDTVRHGNIYDNLAKIYHFDVHAPWHTLSKEAQHIFLYGTENRWTRIHFVHKKTGKTWQDRVEWRGALHEARQRYEQATSAAYKKNFSAYFKETLCPSCKGSRLKPYPSAATIQGKTIAEYTHLPIDALQKIFTTVEIPFASDILYEIQRRLRFLMQVGLHYLTLSRTQPTLSGGEMQRVQLASHICSGLVGTTYILDEPSIGLHPKDTQMLIHTFRELQQQGNRVIVVEHDPDVIASADHIVDVGPGAGVYGGKIVYTGPFKGLLDCQDSITGAHLSGKAPIDSRCTPRPPTKKHLTLKGATHHNLKNITLKVPLGRLVAAVGVSGSGKSSLVTETLYPALAKHIHQQHLPAGPYTTLKGFDTIDNVLAIDQSPIGRTPRSNPATYTKAFDAIRALFAALPESRARGLDASAFSFNVKEGSCPKCHGMGMIRIDMDFMEDEFITCTHCQGMRFDKEILSITYKGKNIHDVLSMHVDEALAFLPDAITAPLKVLADLGLGYLTLGQPAPTLSGGEAQRVKLARELSKPTSGHTFYLLDEPTTGLHMRDVYKLLTILHALVERGNTVLVIEHNMDLVRHTDWVFELGPSGGIQGGELLFEGTPKQLAKEDTPTGRALREERVPAKDLSTATPPTHMRIEGAKEHNLKNLSLNIPLQTMSAITGPSGAGKSTLAFHTLYAEGQRRYMEALPLFARQFIDKMPKPHVDRIEGLSAALCIERKPLGSSSRSTLGTLTEIHDYLRILFTHMGVPHCPATGKPLIPVTQDSIFTTLKTLTGTLSILAPLQPPLPPGFVRARIEGTYTEITDPPQEETLIVIDRLSTKSEKRLYEALTTALTLSHGTVIVDTGKEDLHFTLGCGISSSTPSIRINDQTIEDVENLSLHKLQAFLVALTPPAFLQETKAALLHRIDLLLLLGLGYLATQRTASTLSSGEMQRIHLARQLGTGLTGCLYVLEEPACGLHPQDLIPLHSALQHLKEQGNTIILVEHNLDTLRLADRLFELGPSGGKEGGYLIAEGTPKELEQNKDSLTGAYLNGTKTLLPRGSARTPFGSFTIKNMDRHNLKNLTITFPLGVFSCITGVSGAGKTTLMSYLAEKEEALLIEPHRGGYSSRSDIATYMDILTPLRLFFAELPIAQAKGLRPANFSYNSKEGMCTKCAGKGYIQIDLYFLPPTRTHCDACKGFRLTPLSLEVAYKDKHLGAILQLTVEEAKAHLPPHRKLVRLFDALIDTGLGYLPLCQELQTLASGEAMRLQIAKELAKPRQEPTLYLFDEPMQGLHMHDIARILSLFHRLVDAGHTVICIDHHEEVARQADYRFILGPGAGPEGGTLVSTTQLLD